MKKNVFIIILSIITVLLLATTIFLIIKLNQENVKEESISGQEGKLDELPENVVENQEEQQEVNKPNYESVYSKIPDGKWMSKGAKSKTDGALYVENGKVKIAAGQAGNDVYTINHIDYGTAKYVTAFTSSGQSISYILIVSEEGNVYRISQLNSGDGFHQISYLTAENKDKIKVEKMDTNEKVVDVLFATNGRVSTPYFLTEQGKLYDFDKKEYTKNASNTQQEVNKPSYESVYSKIPNGNWMSKGAKSKFDGALYVENGKVKIAAGQAGNDVYTINHIDYGTAKYVTAFTSSGQSISYILIVSEEGNVYRISQLNSGDGFHQISYLTAENKDKIKVEKMDLNEKVVDVLFATNGRVSTPYFLTEQGNLYDFDKKEYNQ